MKLWVLLLAYILIMLANGIGILSLSSVEFKMIAALALAAARSR